MIEKNMIEKNQANKYITWIVWVIVFPPLFIYSWIGLAVLLLQQFDLPEYAVPLPVKELIAEVYVTLYFILGSVVASLTTAIVHYCLLENEEFSDNKYWFFYFGLFLLAYFSHKYFFK